MAGANGWTGAGNGPTGDTAARLLSLLICRPKSFERDELDGMLREARIPKAHDWLVNYVVKKSPHAEDLRLAWFADPDPVVASAGWRSPATEYPRLPRIPRSWTCLGCSTRLRRR